MTWSAARPGHVELTGREQLRFYAPTLLAAWLAGLCIAFTVVSAYLTSVRDPLVLTAAGLFGFLSSGSLAVALFFSQRAQLRYRPLPTACSHAEIRTRLSTLARESGWTVLIDEPHRWCAECRSSPWLREALVYVQIAPGDTRIAVLPDFDAGRSVGARTRLTELRQRVVASLSFP